MDRVSVRTILLAPGVHTFGQVSHRSRDHSHELISIGGRDSCCMILNEMLLERGVLRIPARRYENIPLRLSVLILMQRVEYCISKGISESSGAFNSSILLQSAAKMCANEG
mgnify:CR=1 FL=1